MSGPDKGYNPDALGGIRRPRGVTLVALGVLSIAVFNLIGLYQMIVTWDTLKALLSFPPAWLAGIRIFWGISGLVIFGALWGGRNWAPTVTIWGSLLYLAYIGLDRLVFTRSAENGDNFQFWASASILIFLSIYLLLTSSAAKHFFGATNGTSFRKQ